MRSRKIEYWVIPAKADGEFVAHMEVVLDTYARPYAEPFPVLCMDEQPVQLLKETREPLAATKAQPRRGGVQDGQAGQAALCFCFGARAGRRRDTGRGR